MVDHLVVQEDLIWNNLHAESVKPQLLDHFGTWAVEHKWMARENRTAQNQSFLPKSCYIVGSLFLTMDNEDAFNNKTTQADSQWIHVLPFRSRHLAQDFPVGGVFSCRSRMLNPESLALMEACAQFLQHNPPVSFVKRPVDLEHVVTRGVEGSYRALSSPSASPQTILDNAYFIYVISLRAKLCGKDQPCQLRKRLA